MMDGERSLIIVEDDDTFARTLQRSFERRGYDVRVANSPDALIAVLAAFLLGGLLVSIADEAGWSQGSTGSERPVVLHGLQ